MTWIADILIALMGLYAILAIAGGIWGISERRKGPDGRPND